MTYVISDIHGCYRQYRAILEKIKFSDDDTLYILGDVIDRGEEGIKTLLDIMARKNVRMLCGNHEYLACRILTAAAVLHADVSNDPSLKQQLELWIANGGEPTYLAFQALDHTAQRAVLTFLQKLSSRTVCRCGCENFLLAHTVPVTENAKDLLNCESKEFLFATPDYERTYFQNMKIVTGHIPTFEIDPDHAGRIIRKNNHIAVDCGVSFGYSLGCICLDTMEEFYAASDSL